ncbi:MAG: cysteine desulfurase [Candidatus Eremiobacteraeota bacterium]|nr:cysteine desulfurase [Candidatus Eremiobacteraeota bacterium]MBV9055646.1 cysteine desulfurase [Candidatus Eremiobacteraeota bacterium]MBV9700228.1 cysteine desulfurase [Candidatus Eremiobacteraeota bacterium]
MNSQIYLDHAATTPLRGEVVDEMRGAQDAAGYNPSSLHAPGRRARVLLDNCRDRVAAQLGATRTEVIFNSGGTESNNQALLGILARSRRPTHVVASAIEHRAVLATLEYLSDEGCEISLVPVQPDGVIDPQRFADALRPNTQLASVMYANNEIGSVQPVAALAAVARERGILFHTDAVQAPCWLPLGVETLGVDLLSLSAHKFGGPKGLGVLYCRRGVTLTPLIHGGGQESGRRAGTENVAGIAGMARALELASEERDAATRIAQLRDWLEAQILGAVDGVRVNGTGRRLPNVLNLSFDAVESAELLIRLDLAGIAASAGSACASGALQASHVLAALGLPLRWQRGAVRFSLGAQTARADVERVAEVLPPIVADLRAHAPAA